MNNQLPFMVASRTLSLLDERRARLYPDRKAFYVWERDDRVVVIFDPNVIDTGKVNADFAHRLSTRLLGRQVVRTNTRGLFLQVALDIPPALTDLAAEVLDFSKQPTPFDLPVGTSHNGDVWVNLLEGDSFFVVGMRGMGKSGLLHGFIQSLLYGGETLVMAWDGKDNAEYLRYVGTSENFTLFPMDGLQAGLQALQAECDRRMRLLAHSGYPNIISYNQAAAFADILKPIALVIDEVAEVEDQALLLKQVKVNRAAGVFPVFATNDPTKSAVIAKSNLATRISFPVISSADSVTGFGRPGANKLPRLRGRGLIIVNARVVEFQSYQVSYPKPTESALEWLKEQYNRPPVVSGDDGIEAQIREYLLEGMSPTAVIKAVWGSAGGANYYDRSDIVKRIQQEVKGTAG